MSLGYFVRVEGSGLTAQDLEKLATALRQLPDARIAPQGTGFAVFTAEPIEALQKALTDAGYV